MTVFYREIDRFLGSSSWGGVSGIVGLISLILAFTVYFSANPNNDKPNNYLTATGVAHYEDGVDPKNKNSAKRVAEIKAQRKIAEKIGVMVSSKSEVVDGELTSDLIETAVNEYLKSIEVVETREVNGNSIHVKIRVPINEN